MPDPNSHILIAAIAQSLDSLEAAADTLVAICDAAREPVLVKRLVLEALTHLESSKLALHLELEESLWSGPPTRAI